MVWKYTDVPPNIPLLSSNVANLSSQVASAQQQIANLIGSSNQTGAGGINITEDFTNPSLYPLGSLPSAKWATVSGSPAANNGIYSPGTPGYNGIYGDVAWFLQYNVSGTWSQLYKATQYATDNASISARMASNGDSAQPTMLFLHSDLAFSTSYMAAYIYSNKIYLVYVYFTGGTPTPTIAYTANVTVNNGDLITLYNQGTTWYIKQNGTQVAAWTDVSGRIIYGSTNRYGGYQQTIAVNIFGASTSSFAISSITFSDAPPVNLKGIGWGTYRAATTSPANLPSGNQQLQAGTLDTVQWANGVTATGTAGQGGYKIQFEGRYLLTQQYYIGGAIPSGNRAGVLVWYQPSGGSLAVARMTPETVNPANTIGGVCTLYLYPNDIVYAGVYNQAFGMGIYGDAIGLNSRWEGIKIT